MQAQHYRTIRKMFYKISNGILNVPFPSVVIPAPRNPLSKNQTVQCLHSEASNNVFVRTIKTGISYQQKFVVLIRVYNLKVEITNWIRPLGWVKVATTNTWTCVETPNQEDFSHSSIILGLMYSGLLY